MPTDRPGHPHANSAFARYLNRRIEELRGLKTQREIAAEAGYARPNILSMLKSGETAVALARIPALAKALDADPGHLFRLAMVDQAPELAAVIDEVFGKLMATKNEAAIFLTKWRAATDDADPAPNAQIDVAVDQMLAAALRSA
jgi:hypothetical protein